MGRRKKLLSCTSSQPFVCCFVVDFVAQPVVASAMQITVGWRQSSSSVADLAPVDVDALVLAHGESHLLACLARHLLALGLGDVGAVLLGHLGAHVALHLLGDGTALLTGHLLAGLLRHILALLPWHQRALLAGHLLGHPM